MHISMRVYGWTPFYSSYLRLCWSNIFDGIKLFFQDTGISCIVKPRIHSGNSCIRLIFFLFGNKIASLFDQKFRTKYLLFRKSRRAFSSIPIPKSINLIIIMHACVYKMDTSIKF